MSAVIPPVVPPPPVPETPPNNLTPSGSTVGSGIGAALSIIIVYAFHMKGIDFPAGVEAAIGAVVATLAGYMPDIAVLKRKSP